MSTSAKVRSLLVFRCFTIVVVCAAPEQQPKWDDVVDQLRAARPEFASFCDTFAGGRLMTWLTHEQRREVRILVIAPVEQRYSVMLQYELTFGDGFVRITAFRDEHRSFSSIADQQRLREGQVLAPIILSREDVALTCSHGATYLDKLYAGSKRANKSLQPTPTAVMPPAAQEIMPAVGVAEH
jgi:hypothetical protein